MPAQLTLNVYVHLYVQSSRSFFSFSSLSFTSSSLVYCCYNPLWHCAYTCGKCVHYFILCVWCDDFWNFLQILQCAQH